MLRSMVLKMDDKINEISDKVQLKVLGSNRATSMEGGEGGEMR